MQIKGEDSADEAERNHCRHPGLKDKDQQMVQQEATEQGTQVEQSRGAEQEETKQSCDEKKMWKKNDMGAEQEATEQSSDKKNMRWAGKKIAMCTYFKKNMCWAGENCCYFAHSREELGQPCRFGPHQKNQLCHHWWDGRECPNIKHCQLAHGEHELGDPKPPEKPKQKKARQPLKEDQVQRRGPSPSEKSRRRGPSPAEKSQRRGPSPSARSGSDSRNGHSQSRKAKYQSDHSFRREPGEVARRQLPPVNHHVQAGRKTKWEESDEESDSEELRQSERRRRHDSRQRRCHDSREKVLPIIIQTCSLFPLCSNLSAK